MEDWEKQALEAKKRKELKTKYPLLGKIVRRKNRSNWDYGVIILSNALGTDEYFINYDNTDEDDIEQLHGLPYEEAPDYQLKHINTI